MPTLFCNPGRIAALIEPGCGLPIQFSLECWKEGTVFRAIITQVVVQNQGGFQFMHTLRDKIFLYIFGERIGQMSISGLTFAAGCAVDGNSNFTGIEAAVGYYQTCRATKRSVPLQVSIGRLAFKAFLLGVKTDIVDPDTGLGHFNFTLFFPPTSVNSGSAVVGCPEPGQPVTQSSVSTIIPVAATSGNNTITIARQINQCRTIGCL